MSQPIERTTRTLMTQEAEYRFRVRFDHEGMPDLITDETPPLGEGQARTRRVCWPPVSCSAWGRLAYPWRVWGPRS